MTKLFGFLFVALFVVSSFSQKGDLEIFRTDSSDYVLRCLGISFSTNFSDTTKIIKTKRIKYEVLFSLPQIDSGISPEIALKSFENSFSGILIDTVSVKYSCVRLSPLEFKKCIYVLEAQHFPKTGTLKPVLRRALEKSESIPIFIYTSLGLILLAIVFLVFSWRFMVIAMSSLALVPALALALELATVFAPAFVPAFAPALVFVLVFVLVLMLVLMPALVTVIVAVIIITFFAIIMQSYQAFFIMLVVVISVFLLACFPVDLFKKRKREGK